MLNLSRTLENVDISNNSLNVPNKNSVKIARLAGQNITEINELKNFNSLEKLNISFSNIKKIPILKSLKELQMIEVDLDDYNDFIESYKFKKT